eukprot:TRINITY_DN2910_c6_g1::TRINITY_DN2910_c6_g1_i20::g.3922::m.3922 TRINITY_DN2910_c6_g1::TRINITY_DN2910_c6_g1_i20::g.3922  ORF type:complete len:310 (+),score=43.09,sp/B0G143/UCPB_DICDI/45.16/6e-86,sp/B0G143/UCPB_DICDI/30.21/9e-10,Mito_carr/PF00153.22/2e-17,Mito_carr/PF00153.22/5.1e-23,Mito_carr/PF00153.22/2.4e-21,NifU/PF01106.12/4.4e+03,NifU/PF01106.12/0.28 TRINITY_DN2910_c6_g1_i20:544-1473(+)
MVAAAITNPIDVIKVRLQLQGQMQGQVLSGANSTANPSSNVHYRGFLRGSFQIAQAEGVSGLYKGLTASLMREGTYSSLRIGLYEVFKPIFSRSEKGQESLLSKIASGACSGCIGAAMTTPTDLVKVRMQADLSKNKAQAKYPSTLKAFAMIYQSGGMKALYQGTVPNTQRAAIISAAQLGSYDHIKQTVLRYEIASEGFTLHFICSMLAGLVTAIASSPVDVIKSRIMNQSRNTAAAAVASSPSGAASSLAGPQYANSLDCFVKILRYEGPLGLYKGFVPNYLRLGPHTIVTFVVYEQLRKVAGLSPV